MGKLINICVASPKRCIVIFILVTLFLLWQSFYIEIDSNLWNVLPEDRISSNTDSAKYGYLFLGLEAKKGEELFTLEGLLTLEEVIAKLTELEEIDNNMSLFNIETLLIGGAGRLISGGLLPEKGAPKDELELDMLKNRAISDPFIKDVLLCNSGTLINTIFVTSQSSARSNDFVRALNSIIEPLNNYYNVSIAGDLVLSNRAEYFLLKDFSTLLIGALFVMLILFFISFRAKRALILPVTVVLMGVIWCIGFMSILGFKLTIVSCIVPALVLTIGSSYTIHVLNEIFRNSPKEDDFNKFWVSTAVNHINKTIVMAAGTTIVGFISLTFASQDIIKEFAVSVSFGVLTVALLSVFFLPAIFTVLANPSSNHQVKAVTGGVATKLGNLGYWTSNNHIPLLIIGVLIALSSIYSVPKLRIGSDYYDYFPKGDPVISKSLDFFKKSGGTLWANVTFESSIDGYFDTVEGLKNLSDFEDYLNNNPYVYSVDSMVTYLKKINKLRFGEYKIPERKGLISLLKRYFEKMSKEESDEFRNVPLVDGNKVTFYIRIYDKEHKSVIPETEFHKFLDPLDIEIKDIFPEGINWRYWGNGYAANTASSLFLKDQLLTMAISFIVVLFITSIYFKSLFFGIVSVIPLITAICLNYMFMILLDIPLDLTTIMVSSVAIGVGIDDAIHFLIQYKRQLNQYPNNISRVLYNTFKITGRPILLTTISIVCGMLVLSIASFLPIRYFGVLVSLALVGALIGTLLFLPATLIISYNFFKKSRKIDNLGNN